MKLGPRADLHVFRDRREAGRLLAGALGGLRSQDPIVLALPRGGVPVAFEVARALGAPLDVLVARKVGAPGNPEFAIGAVAEEGAEYLDHRSVRRLMVSQEELEYAIGRARAEVRERVRRYRGGAGPPRVRGRTVVIVDDGLATGATARAAVRSARAGGSRRVVVAVPVGAPESIAELRGEADEVVCLEAPDVLLAIGLWYESFAQTSDAEVMELLRLAGEDHGPADAPGQGRRPPRMRAVEIAIGGAEALRGDLAVPERAAGLVIFAHGSGSSRHSPRNRHVAELLDRGGLATLLVDLLTPQEELDRRNVFDVELLAQRLDAASRWAVTQPGLAALPVGYLGASTGAAAALWAAAEPGARVAAVVSRGGRPDLAAARLCAVTAPTLLIVGSRDTVVLELNRHARAQLRCRSELAVVRGATHLFEEPGALDEAAQLARQWFARHLADARRAAPGTPDIAVRSPRIR